MAYSKAKLDMNAEDETNITDIEFMPDGRIYVFGTSPEVLEVLDEMQGGQDAAVKLRRGRNVEASSHPHQNSTIPPRDHHE